MGGLVVNPYVLGGTTVTPLSLLTGRTGAYFIYSRDAGGSTMYSDTAGTTQITAGSPKEVKNIQDVRGATPGYYASASGADNFQLVDATYDYGEKWWTGAPGMNFDSTFLGLMAGPKRTMACVIRPSSSIAADTDVLSLINPGNNQAFIRIDTNKKVKIRTTAINIGSNYDDVSTNAFGDTDIVIVVAWNLTAGVETMRCYVNGTLETSRIGGISAGGFNGFGVAPNSGALGGGSNAFLGRYYAAWMCNDEITGTDLTALTTGLKALAGIT